MNDLRFHTENSVREEIKKMQETFPNKRKSVAQELQTQGIDELIPILKRYYPMDYLHIYARVIEESLIKIKVKTEFFTSEMPIRMNHLAESVCTFMENMQMNDILYRAASDNIEVLNTFMKQFDTEDRIVRYVIGNGADLQIADISAKGVTFIVDVEDALQIGNFAFAKKFTMGDAYPEVLDIDYDNEVRQAMKFFTAEDIFKAAKTTNTINRTLGISVRQSPATIIKKVFYERSPRRPDGYVFENNKYTVFQDDKVLLEYTLTEKEIERRGKPVKGFTKVG